MWFQSTLAIAEQECNHHCTFAAGQQANGRRGHPRVACDPAPWAGQHRISNPGAMPNLARHARR